MKLPNFLEFKPFLDIRKQMGAEKLGEFNLSLNWEELTLEENEILEKEGIEVKPNDLRFLDDGTIAFKNRRILLYIRDVKFHPSHDTDLPKFHISNCATLDQMIAHGRFKRYVVSVRTDGIFNYNIISFNQVKPHEGELDVCKNCLRHLNYNNYNVNKTKAFKAFDLNEFFVRFACSPIRNVPLETNRTAPINVYPADWNQKSIKFKKSANWKCNKCKVDLSADKRFLHSHHKNGNTYDNRPSNIEVLCIGCHSSQPNHGQLKKHPQYKEYMEISKL